MCIKSEIVTKWFVELKTTTSQDWVEKVEFLFTYIVNPGKNINQATSSFNNSKQCKDANSPKPSD